MNNNKLVIFDFDGVVVESEIVFQKVFLDGFRKHGINLTGDDLIMRFAGNAKSSFNDILREDMGIDKKVPDDFQKNCIDETANRISEVKPVDGIVELLEYLNENDIQYVIASGGKKDWIEKCLKQTKLKKYFPDNIIFPRDMVKKGKPNPAIFHLAAKVMGYDRKDCVVIEDSENGIKAGLFAGMKTVAFMGGEHCSSNFKKYISKKYNIDVINNILDVKDIFSNKKPLNKKIIEAKNQSR